MSEVAEKPRTVLVRLGTVRRVRCRAVNEPGVFGFLLSEEFVLHDGGGEVVPPTQSGRLGWK